jgi:hypothetical protein
VSGLLCVHAVAITPAGPMKFVRSSSSIVGGLPRDKVGSAPAIVFLGLLSVHSRYGLHARGVAMATLSIGGFNSFVASTAAPIATG